MKAVRSDILHIDTAAGQIPHIYGDNDLLSPLAMCF